MDILNRVYGVAVATTLAALALSFVFDLAGLGAVLLALFGWELAAGGWSPGTAAAGAGGVALAAAGLFALQRASRAMRAWARRREEPGRFRRAAGHLAGAVVAAREAGVLPAIRGLTLGIRGAKYEP